MIRLLSIGSLIVLASLGIGLAGATPPTQNGKREDRNQVRTELVEKKEKDSDDDEAEEKEVKE